MKFFLILLSIAFTMHISAQTAYQNLMSPNDYKQFPITLKKNMSKNHKIGFYIKVMDMRDDTTRLGFVRGDNRTQLYFKFKESFVQYIEGKINPDIVSVQKDTILLVLKKFWAFETKLPVSFVRSQVLGNYKNQSGCIVSAAIYQKKEDGYYQAFNFDSTFLRSGYLGNKADNILSESLSELIRFSDSVINLQAYPDYRTVRQPAKYSLPDLQKPGTTYPILEAENYPDGIYLNFEQFLTNNPVEKKFTYTYRKKKETIQLAEVTSDDSVYTKLLWGFCKNGVPYMRIDKTFSKLTKIENSFEIRTIDLARFYAGYKTTAFPIVDFTTAGLIATVLLNIIPQNTSVAVENISPFKLDLHTGQLY